MPERTHGNGPEPSPDEALARKHDHDSAVERISRQLAGLFSPGRWGTEQTERLAKGPAASTDHYLASILAQATDAILSTDTDGLIVTWNAGSERLLGYQAEEAIGRRLDLLDARAVDAVRIPRQRASLEESARRVVRTGLPEQLDVVCRRANGTFVDLAASIAPIREDGGHWLGLSVIARDISDRRRLEDALREANRQKDAFLALMSHELRTPLTSILGYSDMLVRGMAGQNAPRQRRYLENVRTAGQRLLELVNGLLEYSRLEAGGERLELQPVDLEQALGRAVDRVQPEVRSKRIDLRLTVQPRLGQVVADEEKLQQILAAFLANALKFTPEGGHVWAQAELDPEVAGFARIGVQDTGVGLSPDQLDLVWERFYQVDSSLTRDQSGIGLGLALARHLAALHGARVWVRSEGLGKGSTFYLSLPLVNSAHLSADAAAA